jgi:hypothetical protein
MTATANAQQLTKRKRRRGIRNIRMRKLRMNVQENWRKKEQWPGKKGRLRR